MTSRNPRGRVDLLYLQRFVEDEDAVCRVVDDRIGEGFRLAEQVRQAHRDFGLALIDRNGLFAAGIVAAGAAVELLLGTGRQTRSCGESPRRPAAQR